MTAVRIPFMLSILDNKKSKDILYLYNYEE